MDDFFSKTAYLPQDITNLIELRAEESIHLEFKSSGSLAKNDKVKNEISKDISSFANSDGGILIYGVAEKDHVAQSISFIDGNLYTKEWLEQVISSRITKRISDLMIYPIRFNNDIGSTVYVVRIPQSNNAPHMASDKRFYKRYNFESVPMAEYEIRDVYNRRQKTDLAIEDILFSEGGASFSAKKCNHLKYQLRFQISNLGNSIEELYKLEITIPKLIYLNYGVNNPINSHLIRSTQDNMVFSIPNESPIFQNEITSIGVAGVQIDKTALSSLKDRSLLVKLFYSDGQSERHFDLKQVLVHKGNSIDTIEWS